MNKDKNPELLKTLNEGIKNLQLNMDVLSSLKPLRGKLVNLKSDNFLPKDEETDEKYCMINDKFSTASSITKELSSNQFLCYENNMKKSFTTNSAFKPYYLNPITYQTISYNNYNFGTFMSFPKSTFILPNQNRNYINPNQTANSFYLIKYNYQPFNQNIPLTNSPETLFYIPTIKNKTAQKSITNKKEINQIKKDITQINKLLNKKRISETEIKINKDDVIKNNNLINNNKNDLFICYRKKGILTINFQKNN